MQRCQIHATWNVHSVTSFPASSLTTCGTSGQYLMWGASPAPPSNIRIRSRVPRKTEAELRLVEVLSRPPRSAGIVSCNARARPLPRPGCLKKNAHLYERHARDPQARLHAPLAPGNVPDRAQEMRTLRRRLHLATSSAQKHEERKSQAYRPEEI